MAKQKAVYRAQYQTFGTACCAWYHADVLGQQTFIGNVLAGQRASVNTQRPHGSTDVSFCTSK
jgi:hypothetical protein